ncbi:MAG: hypothetical protein IKF37_00940 [Bacilli bacterium]|nr:hypothetical protein [Bacilli bacterium]
MEKEIKRYEIIEKVLILGAIIIGVITVIDIFLPDPIFLLDEASLAAITGLLTYLSSIVRKRIEELKNGEKKKINAKDIEEITTKVTETAASVNRSRKK